MTEKNVTSKKYFLREFKKGDYMLWSVCSQCYYTYKVVIKDDHTVYANITKDNNSTNLQKLEQEAKVYNGGTNLCVEITFDDSRVDIKESIVSGGITDAVSNTVGYIYTYCIEDGTDKDYNDAYINIIAWRNQG